MSKEMLREDLLASFQNLQQQFDSSLEEAKALDKKFSAHYNQFNTNLTGLLADAREKLPDASPLSQSLKGFISGLEKLDSDWKASLENQNKGLSFRKNFEDSLLVYVYGKVKSGKSSLGNYMAWGYTNPTHEQQQGNTTLKYESHDNTDAENGDAHNEAAQQGKFRVGATEATSSIQSFRLPGLTWVDSPGLHSVRSQNGELAKEHADHADLILYTMKSDAPGRASDLKEIRQLFGKEKNIMLLLTGSDKKQHGWDDVKDEPIEHCVMKPLHDRELQQNFVKSELRDSDIDVSSMDILSISTRYAELHADNKAAIHESGMGQLFTRLHDLSQSQGVRMKRAVPMTNFKNFLTGCLREVREYHKLTGALNSDLETLDADLDRQIVPAIRTAQSAMRSAIQNRFDELAASRNDEYQLNAALKMANTQWDRQMSTLSEAALETILSTVMADFKANVTSTWQSSSLSLPAFSVEKMTEQIPDGYTKSTRGRNSGAGALVGGLIGTFLGGPLGAAIGAGLGGGVGSMMGDRAQQTTRTIEFAVGDNLNELRTHVLSHYHDGLEKAIKHNVDTLFSALVAEMKISCARVNDEIKSFERALSTLKESAEKQLSPEVN